jgi:cyclophilin family peptidyl-prolyl cis-trans isomerase
MKKSLLLMAGLALLAAAPAAPAFAQGKLGNPAALNEKAPAVYKARFDTSKGSFVVEVRRDWSPNGADRLYNLVKNGFFDDVRFFRVLKGFVAQFGINGDPKVSAPWHTADIKDDPVKQSNKRGTLSFATSGPNSRTTQVFVNLHDNTNLDGYGFSPVGRVVSGMKVVDSLYGGYGDGPPEGSGPDQGRMQMQGNSYLIENFPKLDYVKKATIEK